MDHMISRLSQIAAKGGAFAMLAALAAYAVSSNPLTLLAFPIMISIVQLLCLIEGPWTQPILQHLPVAASEKRRLRR